MNIEKLFSDKSEVDEKYRFFIKKGALRKIPENPHLVQSHIEKARHNMQFFDKNKEGSLFND